MGQAVATLADFEVNPSVMVQTCELVFVDEILWNVQDFDANVFQLGHGCVEVEVLKVDGAKACTFLQEYTVEEELEQFQGCCVGTHIARVADAVATNGMVHAWVGQNITPLTSSKGYFCTIFTYNELVTSRVHPQQHKQPTNTTTMVMEPLTPPAAWIR